MHSSSTRKCTLFDAMILVAATAAGMALLRMFLAEGRFFQGAFFQGRFTSYVLSGIEAAFPFLMTWTFALVILGLRQPRPRIRRLVRQPGIAACSAASSGFAVDRPLSDLPRRTVTALVLSKYERRAIRDEFLARGFEHRSA